MMDYSNELYLISLNEGSSEVLADFGSILSVFARLALGSAIGRSFAFLWHVRFA